VVYNDLLQKFLSNSYNFRKYLFLRVTPLYPHNILQAWASRPFSTVQKSIQQHPRSAATLDSHDL
jgi:hypothetical protein